MKKYDKKKQKGFSFCDHCSSKGEVCIKCPLKGGDK